jgi:hypothetical protein
MCLHLLIQVAVDRTIHVFGVQIEYKFLSDMMLAGKTLVDLVAVWAASAYVKIFIVIRVIVDPFGKIFQEVFLHTSKVAVIINHDHVVSNVLKLFEVDLGILANQE